MASKEWFAEWFDSPYYHLLYAHRDEQEAERFVGNITRHINLLPPALVMDVACGKGRHSRNLSRLGYRVTGIDLSPNSIEEAKREGGENLEFSVWDMRQTFARGKFDAVFNLFSSFGYFDTDEEDQQAIAAMYDSLKPGGVLVLDYINTEYAVKKLVPREIKACGSVQFHITRRVADGFICKHISFLADGENHEYEEKLKVINRYHFGTMLEKAGFIPEKTFGDYDLNSFEPGHSPRLILVARKPLNV